MRRFDGKIAIVTGGANGIGAACVRRLAAEGATVYAMDRDGAALDLQDRALRAQGNRVTGIALDITDEAALAEAFATATASGRLDILFAVAGIWQQGPIEDLAPAVWDRIYAVNVRAMASCCRLAVPVMARGGGGAMVTMASISGLRGDAGWAAYNTTKAAVINLTQCLAWEVGGRGIRVNTVCPGPIATAANIKDISDDQAREYAEVCAIPRMGTADEVAGAMAFLASDDASYVTGAALVVDGGLTARTGQPV